MNVKIDYRNKVSKKSAINQVLFVNENFSISKYKKYFLNEK